MYKLIISVLTTTAATKHSTMLMKRVVDVLLSNTVVDFK